MKFQECSRSRVSLKSFKDFQILEISVLDFELGSADCQNKFEIVNNYLFQMISHFKGTPPRFSFVIKKLVAIQSLKSGGSSCLADFRKIGQQDKGYYLAELWHRAKNDTKTIKMINENGLWRVSQFVIKMNQRKKLRLSFESPVNNQKLIGGTELETKFEKKSKFCQ